MHTSRNRELLHQLALLKFLVSKLCSKSLSNKNVRIFNVFRERLMVVGLSHKQMEK